MLKRSEMKKRAKQTVKKHYGILLAACLIAAFLGAEFADSLSFVKQYKVDASGNEVTEESSESLSTGATSGDHRATYLAAAHQALSGDFDSARKTAGTITDEAVKDTKSGKGNQVLGRSRGVLASLVNGVSSGTILLTIMGAVQNAGLATNVVLSVTILLAALVSLLVWFFLTNMYQAVSRRVFLESRVYEKVSVQRFLVFLRVRKWCNVSMVMFMKSLFQMLWTLTVVGGIIKKYSYYMVPYIVAENPNIHWREAITLSRKMMKGHKMECFIYELSFLPWDILGGLTFGISDLFYVNLYKIASYSEYYAQLRALAKKQDLEGSRFMNDTYLFEKADKAVLAEAYKDIVALAQVPEKKIPLEGIVGILANVFGITILNRKDEAAHEANEERRLKIQSAKAIVDGQAYPGRLSAIPEKQKNPKVEQIHYLRHYSITSLILLFFIFSFIGWTWEVSLHLITDGEFVNRGVLHGPWLPIYGTGGVLILIVLNKFREKPALEFITTVLLCGCVEYFTAYYLELTHGGQKWWDYSGYFLNLHGRICAEGLLVFGVGGMAIVYAAAPLLDNYLRKMKYAYVVPLCVVLLLIYGGDQVYSKKHPNTGKGITDYTGASNKEQTEIYELVSGQKYVG